MKTILITGGAGFIGSHVVRRFVELCRQMDERLGRAHGPSAQLITFVKDRPGHDLRFAIDASKINKDLGREPSVSFEQGLSKTIDWYLTNQEWLDHVTSGDYQQYYEKQYNC